jgi:anti-sigma B factor antagonist
MIFQYKSQDKEGVKVLHLLGELIDREQPKSMIKEVESTIASGKNKFLLDMKELKYINSSGLNVLINILTKARKASGDVAICNINEKNKELLLITRLDSIFNVCDSEDEALKLLAQ